MLWLDFCVYAIDNSLQSEHFYLQAFCLPIIQIVCETLKDIKEGKGSKGKKATSMGKYPSFVVTGYIVK